VRNDKTICGKADDVKAMRTQIQILAQNNNPSGFVTSPKPRLNDTSTWFIYAPRKRVGHVIEPLLTGR
jgi:hypothetical protein